MAEITKYVLVDLDNTWGDYEFNKLDEAIELATRAGDTAVLELTYSFSDSALVWTPDGGDIWPPIKPDPVVTFLTRIATDGFTRPGEAKRAAAELRALIKENDDAGK